MMPKIKVKHNSVAILGFHSGSAGQTETWFEEVTGYHLACFVHETPEEEWAGIDAEVQNKMRVSQRMDYPTQNSFKGHPFIASLNWIEILKDLGINKVLPLTEENRVRLRQIEACQANGIELVSAVHPTAIIEPDATLEPGVWISFGSMIGYKAELQTGVVITHGVIVGQHNVIERCAQVQVGTTLGGNVTVRECATIHAGVTIVPGTEIGHDAIIGAGAVVIDSISACSTAVGVPARVNKSQ